MSRRSTPERIDEARRAASRNRLIGEGVTEPTADARIAAWEAAAAEDPRAGRGLLGVGVGLDSRAATEPGGARLTQNRLPDLADRIVLLTHAAVAAAASQSR
jgi:hypothetical protein